MCTQYKVHNCYPVYSAILWGYKLNLKFMPSAFLMENNRYFSEEKEDFNVILSWKNSIFRSSQYTFLLCHCLPKTSEPIVKLCGKTRKKLNLMHF